MSGRRSTSTSRGSSLRDCREFQYLQPLAMDAGEEDRFVGYSSVAGELSSALRTFSSSPSRVAASTMERISGTW